MIAALPMYDWPETQGINDVLWARISAKLLAANIAAPSHLTRTANLRELWVSPDLLLAQTCSYPLATILKNKVQYVATPSYSVDGCEKPGHYRSVILMRGSVEHIFVPSENHAILPEWLPHACFAFNSPDSLSGYLALKRDVAAAGRDMPSLQIETGSHRASIAAVACGTADLCTVDCVSWAMALEHEPAAKSVYVAGWTKQRPGLPLITALHTNAKTVEILALAARSVLGAVVLKTPASLID